MAERRPRRRAEDVTRAIRAAVVVELRVHGYSGVTFEGVAKRAQTGKAVLYRRYSSRVAMVLDSIVEEGLQPTFIPASTNLRDDLVAWLSGAHWRLVGLGGDVYRGLVGESTDRELRELADLAGVEIELLSRHVLEPARNRGELGPDHIDPYVLAAPMMLVRDRIIFSPDNRDGVADIVDKVAIPLYRQASGWLPSA
jgi:AcrR family transcriptional regulator